MKKKEVIKIKGSSILEDNSSDELWIEKLTSRDFEDYMDEFATK